MAVSLEAVRNNFARYGLLDEQVVFLKGFFSETLPTAPIRQLSILRVDADLYESTMDVLRNLYSALSAGGYAIFDDYQNLPDCRRAIDDFRRNHGHRGRNLPDRCARGLLEEAGVNEGAAGARSRRHRYRFGNTRR